MAQTKFRTAFTVLVKVVCFGNAEIEYFIKKNLLFVSSRFFAYLRWINSMNSPIRSNVLSDKSGSEFHHLA